MKHLYLTLTFLLPLFGGSVVAQTGMTVFGNCYVSEKASVGFFGDSLTLRADVNGEGNLVMAGTEPQLIAATDQAINWLIVDNPTQVRVKGKLTVRQSLTIRQGTLEVLPLAHLILEPTATVIIATNAHLADVLFRTHLPKTVPGHSLPTGPDAWLTAFPTCRTLTSAVAQPIGRSNPKPYKAPGLLPTETPPRRG